MKLNSALCGLLLGTSLLAANVSVQAAEVDIPASPTGFTLAGAIPVGQSGTITDGYSQAAGFSFITGSLSNHEEIIFTYTLSNGLIGSLTSSGSVGGLSSTATTNPAATTSTVPSSIILATASFPSSSTGVTTITNNSGTQISFMSLFNALFGSSPTGTVKLTYNAVSAVPLPASVLTFGTAVLAMFGFGWYKRKAAEALV